ncbi:MAG: hypothetical protein IAF38_07345 [Bacteroidia bacterium]|nr:hypothetical protein [Bacteroidia bacterium]
MKLPEKILVGLFLIGIILRFFNIPGGTTSFMFTLLGLSLYYLFGGFWAFSYSDKKNGIKENKLWFSIPLGLVAGYAILGIIFKWMIWPGATITLMNASFFLTGSFMASIILLYTLGRKLNLRNYFRSTTIRISVLLGLTVGSFFLKGIQIFSFFHSGDPELVRKFENMQNNPENNAMANEYWDYVDKKNSK